MTSRYFITSFHCSWQVFKGCFSYSILQFNRNSYSGRKTTLVESHQSLKELFWEMLCRGCCWSVVQFKWNADINAWNWYMYWHHCCQVNLGIKLVASWVHYPLLKKYHVIFVFVCHDQMKASGWDRATVWFLSYGITAFLVYSLNIQY